MSANNSKSTYRQFIEAFSGWGMSMEGLISNRQGEWWLIGQLLLITAHLLPAWPPSEKSSIAWSAISIVFGGCLFLTGIFLAAKAFIRLGASLSPLADPKPGAALVTTGAYSDCRHPLYKGLILSSSGVAISLTSAFHLILLIALCFLLRGKAQREEKKLLLIHPEYKSYLANTPAIIRDLPILDWRA